MSPAPMPHGVAPATPDAPCRPKNAGERDRREQIGRRRVLRRDAGGKAALGRAHVGARGEHRRGRRHQDARIERPQFLRRREHGVAASGGTPSRMFSRFTAASCACAQHRQQRFRGRNLRCGALDVEVAREPALQLCLDQRQRHPLRLEVLLGQHDLPLVIAQVEIVARDFREQGDPHRLGGCFLGLKDGARRRGPRLVAPEQIDFPRGIDARFRDVERPVASQEPLIAA